MLELLSLAKLAGWAKAFWGWLGSLPWYLIVIGLLCLVLAWEYHEASSREADLKQARTDLAGWKAANVADAATIKTLRASITAQNANIDDFKEQASSATRRAQDAKAAADKAAAGRAAALATLRAAPPVKNDCDAPAAHVSVKDQL